MAAATGTKAGAASNPSSNSFKATGENWPKFPATVAKTMASLAC